MSTKTVLSEPCWYCGSTQHTTGRHYNPSPRPPETFREHVKKCKDCMVDADGEVWACDEGAAIRQRERKEKL